MAKVCYTTSSQHTDAQPLAGNRIRTPGIRTNRLYRQHLTGLVISPLCDTAYFSQKLKYRYIASTPARINKAISLFQMSQLFLISSLASSWIEP